MERRTVIIAVSADELRSEKVNAMHDAAGVAYDAFFAACKKHKLKDTEAALAWMAVTEAVLFFIAKDGCEQAVLRTFIDRLNKIADAAPDPLVEFLPRTPAH